MGEQAIATAAWTSPYNYVRGNLREDRDCLATALALPSEAGTESRAFALVRMAIIYWESARGTVRIYTRDGATTWRSVGCEWVKAIAVSCMAENATVLGNYEEAIELGQQAIALFRKTGPVYELCGRECVRTRCRTGRELRIEPGAPG